MNAEPVPYSFAFERKGDMGEEPTEKALDALDTLDDARSTIDEVDRQMAALFSRRMQAASQIAAFKAERGLAIRDAEREAAILERNGLLVDAEIRPYYLRFMENVMEESRRYQRRLMEGLRVAYSGVEGAFAWTAALRAFPGAELCAHDNFQAAYDAVVDGTCDCAVLPMENSAAGEVGPVVDLLFNGPLVVNRTFSVPIVQNLLGVPGATIEGINAVSSHPQALMQCSDYLAAHGWELRNASNTAIAAKAVAEAGDPTVAAIAGAETADLYGLEILAPGINDSMMNVTIFGVFSRVVAEGPSGYFVLLFTVKDEAGALAKAVNVVGAHGFNMTSLRSRPMKSLPWSYYFIVEAAGDISSPEGEAMLAELGKHCDRLKVAGRISSHDTLDE